MVSVKTPRFYVNTLEWLAYPRPHLPTENIIISDLDSIYHTLPVSPKTYHVSTHAIGNDWLDQRLFVALLGHNIRTEEGLQNKTIEFALRHNPDYPSGAMSNVVGTPLVNAVPASMENNPNGFGISYDGFSIVEYPSVDLSGAMDVKIFEEGTQVNIGSVIVGQYYDMKNAPNLSLSMSREYGGTKEFTTHNGSYMSNSFWNKPSMWGNRAAWELYDGTTTDAIQKLARSGRRTWDMTFSYMDDSDLWGPNQLKSYISTHTAADMDTNLGYDNADTFGSSSDMQFEFNLLTDDNFFSQVWHKTLGGNIPFIFQPDGGSIEDSNFNPDQFAICRFKSDSLKVAQSAFNVYDISVSIEEAW